VKSVSAFLVTTLTKRTAEDLADYLRDVGLKVRYLHSTSDAIERVEILRGLRAAEFDILVGINLLREGSIYRGSLGHSGRGQGRIFARRLRSPQSRASLHSSACTRLLRQSEMERSCSMFEYGERTRDDVRATRTA